MTASSPTSRVGVIPGTTDTATAVPTGWRTRVRLPRPQRAARRELHGVQHERPVVLHRDDVRRRLRVEGQRDLVRAEHDVDVHVAVRPARDGRDDADLAGEQRVVDVGGEEVGVAHERGHEPGRGRLEDLLRGVGLLDHAVAHHDHPVADRQRLGLVVGHEHRGGAGLAEHRDGVGADLGAERSRRGWRTARRAAPRPAAGRAPGPARPAAAPRRRARGGSATRGGQPDQLEHLADPGGALRARHLVEPEGDVARHRQVREQRVVLEDQARPGAARAAATCGPRRPRRRRSGSCPRRDAPARRPGAGWWTSRSPRGRSA